MKKLTNEEITRLRRLFLDIRDMILEIQNKESREVVLRGFEAYVNFGKVKTRKEKGERTGNIVEFPIPKI